MSDHCEKEDCHCQPIRNQRDKAEGEVKQLKAERTEAWKQRNEMKERVLEIEGNVKFCSECEEPIVVETDTCLACAWKLKH